MDLILAIKGLVKSNIWISIGLISSGMLLLKLSDASVLISLMRRLLPALSYSFIENLFVIGGLTSFGASFYTFYIWFTAYNKKRLAKRKIAMQKAAEEMGWSYSEYLTSRLRNQIDSFLVSRALGIPPHLHGTSQHTSNFLWTETSGVLLIIFDCVISAANNSGDSFTEFETAYLVISDKLNLPYFQTQMESILGDNTVGNFLKKQAGVNDIDFPQRPDFSRKYAVDSNQESILRIFTPAVFDFYEQNQLYRTIGDGKMFCLLQWQSEPINQFQINAQLRTLHTLYQLLKS